MGTLGVGSFDNDTALDWVWELSKTSDLQLVETSLDLSDFDEIDGPDAEIAIAACEVVAALEGRPAAHLPAELEEWIKAHNTLGTAHLIPVCRTSLKRVVSPESELRELWEETEHYKAWRGAVRELSERVSGTTPAKKRSAPSKPKR